MHFLLVLATVFAISWLVSTPESRAAAAPGVERFSRRLFAIAMGLLVLMWVFAGFDPGP